AQVFHVAALVLVERVEDRVGAAIELERLDAKARAQREVEGGRGLHPFAVDAQVGVAVIDEQVAAHGLGQARRGEVVLDVGEADARLDARGARARGEQRGLAYAEAFAGLEHGRGAEHFGVGKVEERVVADLVAHRVVEGDRFLPCRPAGSVSLRERLHRRIRAVDVARGRKVIVHWSSFIRRRAPANSALFGSASPSITEKWFLPGIGMSPAKAARQRLPSSAFWRWNSLDSAPPTQLITGARVAGIMNAGESLCALCASSLRSAFSHSTSSSGRRSYSPLIARPPFHRSLGSARSNTGHSAHISIAVRWPPAEWPETYSRSWSMPYSSACSQSQRLARSICCTISSTPTRGQRS